MELGVGEATVEIPATDFNLNAATPHMQLSTENGRRSKQLPQSANYLVHANEAFFYQRSIHHRYLHPTLVAKFD